MESNNMKRWAFASWAVILFVVANFFAKPYMFAAQAPVAESSAEEVQKDQEPSTGTETSEVKVGVGVKEAPEAEEKLGPVEKESVSIKITPAKGEAPINLLIKNPRMKLGDKLDRLGGKIVQKTGTIDLSEFRDLFSFVPGIKLLDLAVTLYQDSEQQKITVKMPMSIPLVPDSDFVVLKGGSLVVTIPSDTIKQTAKGVGGEAPGSAQDALKAKLGISLSGDTEIKVPGAPAGITATVSGAVSREASGKWGISSLSGTIKTDGLGFKEFSFTGATISITPIPGKFSASASVSAKIMNAPTTVSLKIVTNTAKAPQGKPTPPPLTITLSGTFAQGLKDFSPFTGIPGLEDLKMNDLELGFKFPPAIIVKGTTEIKSLGLPPLTASLEVGTVGSHLRLNLPAAFKLSDIKGLEALKGSFVDQLDLSQDQIIIASKPYMDADLALQIPGNLNFIANIDLDVNKLPIDENLKDVLEKTRLAVSVIQPIPKSIYLVGSLGGSLSEFALKANLQLDLDYKTLTKGVVPLNIKNAGFSITGVPSLAGFADVEFTPPFEVNPLLFTGTIKVDRTGFDISGGYNGDFQFRMLKPLFPNLALALSNCFFTIGYTWQDLQMRLGTAAGVITAGVALTALIPATFGIAGEMTIGETKAGVKVIIKGSSVLDWGLQAYTNHLSLKDVATLIEQIIGKPLQGKENLPDLGIYGAAKGKNVEILASVAGATIGGVAIPPGFRLSGQMKILDQYALLDAGISMDGLKFAASMSEIDLGFFKITGKGNAGRKGPMFDIELSLSKQRVALSGELDLNTEGIAKLLPGIDAKKIEEQFNGIFQAREKVDFSLDKTGLNFEFSTNLFGRFKTQLKGKTVSGTINPDAPSGAKQAPDFFLEGLMQQDFVEIIQKEIEKVIMDINKKVNDTLDASDKNFKQISVTLADIQNSIAGKTKEVAALDKAIEAQEVEADRTEEARLKALNINPALENALKAGIHDVGELQKKLRGDIDQKLEVAEKEVDKIMDQITAWQKTQADCAAAPWWRLDLKIEWCGLGVLIAGAWVTHGVVEAVLKGIQQINDGLPTVDEIRRAVTTVTFNPSSLPEYAKREALKLEINDLNNRTELLKRTQEAGLYTDQTFKDINNFTAQMTIDIAKGLMPINIKEASFSTSLREVFVEGKLPRVNLKLAALGRDLPDCSLQYDVKNPAGFFNDVANYIIKALQSLAQPQQVQQEPQKQTEKPAEKNVLPRPDQAQQESKKTIKQAVGPEKTTQKTAQAPIAK